MNSRLGRQGRDGPRSDPDARHLSSPQRWEQLETSRLLLRRVQDADVDELFVLHADPAVWTHHPQGRHETPLRTARMVATFTDAWDSAGLGIWTARLRPNASPDADPDSRSPDDTNPSVPGEFVGVGGCTMRADGLAWNLYYRLAPAHQRRGYGMELTRAALDAAATHRPELPVLASLLEHNDRSRGLAERLGLRRVFAGNDPNGEGIRLLYADRPLDPFLTNRLAGTSAAATPPCAAPHGDADR